MKTSSYYFFIVMLLSTVFGYSQNFNYQAAVRNSAGNLVINQSVGVQIAILDGSATGTALYTETHTVTTNANGVLNLAIGSGTTTDTFSAINWSLQNQWLDVAVDITGGTTYVTMGTTKLQHVPYSSYANTSGDKAFSTTGNVTSNAPGTIATDDYVFGSTQLADITGASDNNRMFFDKSKGAFRAGGLNDGDATTLPFWDDTNVGSFSTAFGGNVEASGLGAIAIGYGVRATGNYSTALGDYSHASGSTALAIGADSRAESYSQISLGMFNTPVTALNTNGYNANDRLLVIGNGPAVGTRSDALVMLKNGNTTLNGQLTIDGDNQGVLTGYTLPAQDGTASQVMTTDGSGTVSWAAAQALPTGGTVGQVLKSDGAGGSTWSSDIEATSIKVTTLPSFLADLNGSINVTNEQGNYLNVADYRTSSAGAASILHDNGNHFDESTGRFTAPVNGLYFFSAQVRFDGIGSGFARLVLGTNLGISLDGGMHALTESAAGVNFHTLTISGVVKLNANQYVYVGVYASDDTDYTIQTESGFSGYLVTKL